MLDTSRLAVPALQLSPRLRESLEAARSLGVAGVELDARGGLPPEELSRSGVRQIRKWLADCGLTVAAVAFPVRRGFGDLQDLDRRVAATREAMGLARALGASVLTTHAGEIPPDEQDPARRLMTDVLGDLGRHGDRVGVRLALEAGRNGPVALAGLLAALPEPGSACDLVTGALLVHGHDPVESVAVLGSRLAFVHLTDAVAGAFAGRGRAAALGSGQVDLAGVLAAVEERGYRGWIGLEPAGKESAAEELATAVRLVRGL
jgi:L-ribulose-5-phosphate 3-epimerase